MASLNDDITKKLTENTELMKQLNRLQNSNLGARGELKEKTGLYNQILTQNVILLGVIVVMSGMFFLKR